MVPLLPDLIANVKLSLIWRGPVVISIIGVIGLFIGAIVLPIFARSLRLVREGDHIVTGRSSALATGHLATRDVREGVAGQRLAALDLGGYSRQGVTELEGRYVCFRPSFGDPNVINAYLVVIRWDETRSCLVFEEQSRPDSIHTQKGVVYVPDGRPFLNLVTIDKGSVRLIIIARPQGGLARGVIMTLSNPGGTHFIPAATPVVLRRVGEIAPQLGFVHRTSPDYDFYVAQLNGVVPEYGKFANFLATPAPATLTLMKSPKPAVIKGSPRPAATGSPSLSEC